MTLIDSDERIQATNPGQSFIVQAPAGSGKTEILTQRFLRLLGTVTAPEQIIALTFTRKAASEMRERIVLALQQAARNEPAQSPHQQMTLDFARHAMDRSDNLHWDLLQQPNRLRVITIDSLCQMINNAIPLLEKQIAYAGISDNPKQHYLEAGRRCLQYALATPDYQDAIKTLLLHVDNRQDNLLDLFNALLAQRDQWLGPLFQARAQEKSTFEAALRVIEQHGLTRFKQSLPVPLAAHLTNLSREVALIENNPESPRYALCNWHSFEQVNQDQVTGLAQLVLTGDGSFRKAFDHYVGLKRGNCPDAQFERLKEESKELLIQLSECADFHAALLQVSSLPNPEYDPQQWEVLQALFLLLPLLIGHLQLVFSEHNAVDFTAIAQQALGALGDADNPTDLALYLDNAIHHLLIDEFQDTSISQFELVTQLVQGWQPGDGKTLFVVGDPMQSIYRFRQAEVGLFFRAKTQGVGPVTLQSLELRCNFRSSAAVVNWVNQHFAGIFPQQVDIESGAVSFHPSTHVKQGDEHSGVYAFQCSDKVQEAKRLIHLIQTELTRDSEQSIAILVRSRSQLTAIIRLLRQQQIPYQGTDIDLLANLMHLRDVWSLTQALLLPANRLAWLALLRSPYCGLSLSDLHAIATANKKKSIYALLLQLDTIAGISDEGRVRATYFTKTMAKALAQRCQMRLTDWVAQTLKALHVENILNPNQLADLEQFWGLLDRHEQQGRLPDMQAFAQELNALYSQQATPSRLQVMTIHKSKGLEFDTVILPGLGSRPNAGDKPMLRWLKLPTDKQNNLLLVSPIQAAHEERCDLYDYLSAMDEEKSHYEAQRVLYVAVTRAKSRLYLLDNTNKSSKHSFRSLLKKQVFLAEDQPEGAEESAYPLPELFKLPLAYYSPDNPAPQPYLNQPITALSSGIPRLTGIVAHQLLQWICENHPATPTDIPWQLAAYEYKKLGFTPALQAQALATLQEQIKQLFAHPIGSWIIAPHQQEQNEYALLVASQERTITRIIDRLFEHNGTLWIIDFKTGKEDANTLIKYKKQLTEYAECLSSQTNLPIQCGLYYLPTSHWVSWEYQAQLNPV